MTKVKVVICPYCGETQPAGDRCRSCQGLFEQLSRQATHNAMGPWFVRDPERPFQPGASYETLVKMIERGQITKYTILRGPTTKQFWTIARHTPGVAHLLGYCHQCDATVNPKDLGCPQCGAPFGAYLDRNHLGLPEVQAMPWEGDSEVEDASQSVYGSLLQPDPLRPQATGVSSFATDEELTHDDEPPVRLRAASALGGWRGGEAGAHTTPATEGETGASTVQAQPQARATAPHESYFDPDVAYASAAQRRALQRRLTRMRTMNIFLLILVIAVGILGLGALLGWFNNGSSLPSNEPSLNNGEAATQSTTQGSSDGEALIDESERNGDAAEPDTPPIEQPSDDQQSSASDQQAAQWNDQYTRAQLLVEQANDESKDLDARIEALTQAIAMLEEIMQQAPEEQQPEALVDEIARRQRQLRLLEMLKYFPD